MDQESSGSHEVRFEEPPSTSRTRTPSPRRPARVRRLSSSNWWDRFRVWMEKQEKHRYEDFAQMQWQRGEKSFTYLVIRIILQLSYVTWLVATFFNEENLNTWIIYLNHWLSVLAITQGLLGIILVSLMLADVFRVESKQVIWICRCFEWISSGIPSPTCGYALMFWLHEQYEYKINNYVPVWIVNLVAPVTIWMDVLVVAYPCRYKTSLFGFMLVSFHQTFTLFYHLFFGISEHVSMHLDNPVSTLALVILAPLLAFAGHFLLWWVSLARRRAARLCGLTREEGSREVAARPNLPPALSSSRLPPRIGPPRLPRRSIRLTRT